MAKLRVYELAKELKVENKELVRQLLEMGYDVRNHMSVLTTEEAQDVRDKFKQARSEVVEEKRVTTRVIRRRRRKVEADEAPEGLEAAEEEAAEEEVAEEETVEAPAAEAEEAPEPMAVEAEPQPEEPTPAIVETQPEEIPPAEEEAAVNIEAEPQREEGVSEPQEETFMAEPQPEATPEPESEPAAAEQAQPQAPTATVPQPKEAPEKRKAKEPAPAKHRRPSDEPARIISLPTRPAVPAEAEPRRSESRPGQYRPRPAALRPLRPEPAAPAQPDIPPPEKVDEHGRTRRKKGKKTAQIPDDDFLMRKTASKRKEILDKADLYDTRPGRLRRRGAGPKKLRKTEVTTPKAIKRRVKVGEAITVGELAKRMGVKAAEMVGRLLQTGMMVTLNQSLDVEDATLVASEFGFEVERVAFEEGGLMEQAQDQPEDLVTRPPVVTIMGHVDHGKTSLLDAIRRTRVAAGEAGGITQHIGAYDVHLPEGGQVVFVDTPGHEAFTQMRARGAQVTDVVVLVVAADDGVMEQTKEAVNHSRAAGVPIVVAVNKIDKPGADPERVRRELADLGLVSESWGGDTIMAEVSAKTGQGVNELLELLQLQAEILELKANPSKPARGYMLEARLDKGRGPVGTVLVHEGTLRAGDAFVCGVHGGKVRAMFDDLGQRMEEAGPSIPMEVQGFGGVPEAGDEFVVVENDKVAKQIAEHRALKKREAELGAQTRLSLEGFFDQMAQGAVRELSLVVKADVQGSVEALVDALNKLGNEQVKVHVIHAGTGTITETDVILAAASEGIIIGFNVRPTGKVSEVAEAEHVEIRTYEVIYKVIEDVTAALTGLLAPLIEEEVIGRAQVRDTFTVPKMGTVAGCAVASGKVERNAHARLLRDGVVVVTTRIASLRRFKDDVKEVTQGFECGIGLENYQDIKIGDEIEVFVTREVAAKL